MTPLGRWGVVRDVAEVWAFVASGSGRLHRRFDRIVGSTVFVDGGMTLYPRFV
jgi:glucose 1-dehydrogenase